ncbi:MAG: beta-ketoacyl-[acyl-carrier-protein] synthase family protein [Desulfobacteraceae bacterium]|jgi:3-oxoacyl-[acyl-carrier-protein] synthase II
MVDRTPVIIGFDAVSPLGIVLEEQWQKALSGRSGVGPLTRFALFPDFPVRVAGQVLPIDHLDYTFLNPEEQSRWVSPIYKYAFLTVQRALERSGLVISSESADRVAVTYSSAFGGLDAILTADRKIAAHDFLVDYQNYPNVCAGMIGTGIARSINSKGPVIPCVGACASGVMSLLIGAMLLAQDRADVVVCGAVDFPLVEPIVAGFAAVNMAYSPKEGQRLMLPQACSRPFSVDRQGVVIAEGAGCILLATRQFAKDNGLNAAVEIAGWNMTTDAHEQVTPCYESVTRCISGSIENAKLKPDAIHAVNAHANGTCDGDQVEADALRKVFNGNVPPITANKSLFGHAIGASSAIESVLTITAMLAEELPPTINYQPDPALALDSVIPNRHKLIQEYVLKNAFSFTGCNACVIFRRVH